MLPGVSCELFEFWKVFNYVHNLKLFMKLPWWPLIFSSNFILKLLISCSVWVARRPPGYAFIDFEDRRDADDAIRELDGMSRKIFF